MSVRIKKPPMQVLTGPRTEPCGVVDAKGVTLYLPVILSTGNVYIRLHGVTRSRIAKDLEWYILAAGNGIKEMRRKERARALYTRVSTRPLADEDNLVTGFKPLQDALVRTGWFVDDKPQWLETMKPLQLRPNTNLRPGTHVRIEYL